MEVFGSPQALSRAPPLLVFVIDVSVCTKAPQTSVDSHLSSIELIVTRTLLYYFLHVDNRLAWTFQLFDSQLTQPSKIIHQRMPSEFSLKTLRLFSTTLRKFVSQCSQDLTKEQSEEEGTAHSNPKFSVVCSSLDWAIQEMKWDWNTSLARMQGTLLSPPQRIKSFDKLSPLISYKIRNYVFLLSKLPQTLEESRDYLGIKDMPESWELVANQMSDVLFGSGNQSTHISIGLLEKRSSLSMIDLSIEPEQVIIFVTYRNGDSP